MKLIVCDSCEAEFYLGSNLQPGRNFHGRMDEIAILNIDVTVICETPKIQNYKDKIIKNISNITKLSIDDISIKATTTEGLGFIGRNEGIAVMSNVMIYI